MSPRSRSRSRDSMVSFKRLFKTVLASNPAIPPAAAPAIRIAIKGEGVTANPTDAARGIIPFEIFSKNSVMELKLEQHRGFDIIMQIFCYQ